MRSAVTMILAVMLVGGLLAATQPETLVGCLQPGKENGSFVLAEEGAATVPVMSTRVGLTEHLGRQVSLAGRQGTFRGEAIFKVIKVTVVDMSCR
ncbi:MAG TPA: hypothetical protein VH417_13610 [Vicinamibacterales bacterium]|jgi:hypothetical protein